MSEQIANEQNSPSIRPSTSDLGNSPTRKPQNPSPSTTKSEHGIAEAEINLTGGAPPPTSTSDPSQIRRRYHSMNDVNRAALSGVPLSTSLGSFAAANRNAAAPPVDPNALPDMLAKTQQLADSTAKSIEKVAAQLRTMSKLTVENLKVLDETAANSCESAEHLIKTLYSLMSKYDELRKELFIIPTVSQQLKEIERLLDVLEMHTSQADRVTSSR